MNFNKAVIVGNITRDPELKAMPKGGSVCNFGVATNRTWYEKESGQKKEAVEFHNVVVFGKMAETVFQYMRKGSQILVEGRLQTRNWDDKDGKKVYRTEIVAESVQFGSKPKESDSPAPRSAPEAIRGAESTQGNDDGIRLEDIPF
jgi:single-strand DNA-binding protein